jgi:simple sugar transport system ATP-binding protein
LDNEKTAAVSMRGICKTYPGSRRRINKNIFLDLFPGEILCLAGENGAGKSTLMKILCGLEQPQAGSIFLKGKAVHIDSPVTANKLGIGMVHQHFMLFPEFTVAENVVMGAEPRRFNFLYDTLKAEALVNALIEAHHFSIKAGQKVSSLAAGEKQQVEICRMLYRNVDIIILDEPTAVLTEQETQAFFDTLRALKGKGKAIILITHKLAEIKQISDRAAVLRRGELAGLLRTGEIDEAEIFRLMTGRETHEPPSGSAAPAMPSVDQGGAGGEPVITFEDVTVIRRGQARPLLKDLSFTVSGGEILGFAGAGGNGLGVLEAVLGGFLHPVSGHILHCGRDISALNIRRLRNQGLSFVPADRLKVGSAAEATVEENFIIDKRSQFSGPWFLNKAAMRNFAAALISRYGIDAKNRDVLSSLSGGNIQKLILAREIDQFRDYIVFSEPAWGLDFASTAFMYGEIKKLKEKGAAIIIISTNLDEILANADRIIVLYQGLKAVELANDNTVSHIKEKIGAYMLGLKSGETVADG